MMTKYAELQAIITQLQMEVDALQEEAEEKDWPQIRDTFFSYDSSGFINKWVWDKSTTNIGRKDNAMCFRTKEAAELSCKQDKCLRMLMMWADGGMWAIRKEGRNISAAKCSRPSQWLEPRFSSAFLAQRAIFAVGEDLLNAIFDQGEK